MVRLPHESLQDSYDLISFYDQYIISLSEEIANFFSGISPEYNGADYSFSYSVIYKIPPMPKIIKLKIFEILNCLRSSLDYAAIGVNSALDSNILEYNGSFVFGKTEEEWLKMAKHKLADQAVSLLNREIKPYESENIILYLMNIFCNQKKHRRFSLELLSFPDIESEKRLPANSTNKYTLSRANSFSHDLFENTIKITERSAFPGEHNARFCDLNPIINIKVPDDLSREFGFQEIEILHFFRDCHRQVVKTLNLLDLLVKGEFS